VNMNWEAPSKIYIIAGNHQEFLNYVKKKLEWRHHSGETSASMSDYVDVACPRNLRGIKEPHGVFIGSYKEREDIDEITTILLASYEIGGIPQSVRELYNEVRKRK
jgi:hypothetical protein